MSAFEPIWRMPTRSQAVEVLVESRSRTQAMLADLDDAQMKVKTLLGGGQWSVKDLLAHLSGCEERVVAVAKGLAPRNEGLELDERSAAEIERKRKWSLGKVRTEFESVREELLAVIEGMSDAEWSGKIQLSTGRSALGLVLGKILVGGRYGLFAHDLAHLRDLERSVEMLRRDSR